MALYFFDLHECGEVLTDPEGLELAGPEAARAEALRSARSIMMAEVQRGQLCLSCRIIVRDGQQQIVAEVLFRDAVQITGS